MGLKEDFLNGMEEVFSILFTDRVMFRLMDDVATQVNDVYQETSKKVYQEPINLVAKVVTKFTKEELPNMDMDISAIITVPTKQLIRHDIMRESLEDLKTLTRGIFSYKEVEIYEVDSVVPTTLVADEWQFYVFYCRHPK